MLEIFEVPPDPFSRLDTLHLVPNIMFELVEHVRRDRSDLHLADRMANGSLDLGVYQWNEQMSRSVAARLAMHLIGIVLERERTLDDLRCGHLQTWIVDDGSASSDVRDDLVHIAHQRRELVARVAVRGAPPQLLTEILGVLGSRRQQHRQRRRPELATQTLLDEPRRGFVPSHLEPIHIDDPPDLVLREHGTILVRLAAMSIFTRHPKHCLRGRINAPRYSAEALTVQRQLEQVAQAADQTLAEQQHEHAEHAALDHRDQATGLA